jgi:hypothetical protein
MAILPSPAALIELGRYAVGQALESAAALATVPVRAMGLLGQAELLVSRVTVIAEQAEALVQRVGAVADSAEETVREARALTAAAALTIEEVSTVAATAARVVDEAAVVSTTAARVVDDAAGVSATAAHVVEQASLTAGAASSVVGAAGLATAEAREMLDGYAPMLRQAAPLAARFVRELSPEEVSAAIRMIDTLPRLREHLVDDVLPLLGKLDQVGPDLHKLLEVTEDLHLAITGLPGLRMLKRRGVERAADDTVLP